MPAARQAFVPQPVVDRTAAELRAYIEGQDPSSGRPFIHELIDGLTGPLGAADAGLAFDRSVGRLLEPASEDELQDLFRKNGWTDFLPIVLPTADRVERMLTGTSHPPDEVVGHLAPTAYREPWQFTVEKVAVNAVMAGALPEHLPVVLAAMATGMTARQSSTTSFATYLMVNGPIRHALGMNTGIGRSARTTAPTRRSAVPTVWRPRTCRAVRYPTSRTWLPGESALLQLLLRGKRGTESVDAVPRRARV